MAATLNLAPSSLPHALSQWNRFLDNASRQRLDQELFATYAPILASRCRIPPVTLADLLLRPVPPRSDMLDPRVPQYLQVLFKQKLVDTPSVLKALYRYSTSHRWVPPPPPPPQVKKEDAGGDKKEAIRWGNSYPSEELIFWRLARSVSQGGGIANAREAVEVVRVLARWMALFSDIAAAEGFATQASLVTKAEVESARQAFMLLVVGVCESAVVVEALGKDGAKLARRELAKGLDLFIPTIVGAVGSVAQRLSLWRTQTLAGMEPVVEQQKKEAAEVSGYMDLMGMENFQVPEIPVVNSRAGLYIYVGAALVGRPLLDDNALFTYLHNRYQGDTQTTAVQLILASFDVLANSVFRNEGSKTGHLLKSYVVNKVPLILSSLAATSTPMYPFDAQFCISEALGQVDTNIFPTLSGMFDMPSNSSFLDSVRQDFCFSCLLHGLVTQPAIETLLGDITYQSLPDEGRYVKEVLVQACIQDPEKTQKFVGELDNMNGNVGAAAQAIVESIINLCRNKETMTLKQLCGQLASKPLSLDILLLFNRPQKLLHSLCEVLDNWGGYDEDQGEYQPVYEEFGSILLLLLAFIYRYDLAPADLGIRSADSFVGRLWGKGHLARPLKDLTEQEKSRLGGWIHGLFDTEAGGLGDELMSSCPPQDFYLLMPTLFQQIVLALTTGHLTEEVLKGGLEYLVDVLLLPSLVPALLYLSDHLRTDTPQSQRAIIRILHLILRPNSMSTEATSMLSSVLNIVAKPLEQALRSYQRQDPKSTEIEPLLKALKENIPLSRRTGGADHNELESWTSTQPANGANPALVGGLSLAVRNTVQNLIQGAQNPPINGMPSSYTHRQILAALKLLGARRLLAILLDELRAQNDVPTAPVAYDVVTAIVCAPDTGNEVPTQEFGATPVEPRQRRMTLREALKHEAEEWKLLQKGHDPVMAEVVVRLYRRVEAQMVPPPAPPAMLQPELGGLGGDNVALGEAMAAAAAVVAGEHNVDAMSLDTAGLDGTGMDLDLGLGSAAGSVGGLDMSGDDIFSGLDTELASTFDAGFEAWDTMNL
ncbi:hypothetical protein OQA88_3367 [Cercophora sp. LCS_1]